MPNGAAGIRWAYSWHVSPHDLHNSLRAPNRLRVSAITHTTPPSSRHPAVRIKVDNGKRCYHCQGGLTGSVSTTGHRKTTSDARIENEGSHLKSAGEFKRAGALTLSLSLLYLRATLVFTSHYLLTPSQHQLVHVEQSQWLTSTQPTTNAPFRLNRDVEASTWALPSPFSPFLVIHQQWPAELTNRPPTA